MAQSTTTNNTVGAVVGVAISCGLIYLAFWSASKGWNAAKK